MLVTWRERCIPVAGISWFGYGSINAGKLNVGIVAGEGEAKALLNDKDISDLHGDRNLTGACQGMDESVQPIAIQKTRDLSLERIGEEGLVLEQFPTLHHTNPITTRLSLLELCKRFAFPGRYRCARARGEFDSELTNKALQVLSEIEVAPYIIGQLLNAANSSLA
jgi:hypothetical protein